VSDGVTEERLWSVHATASPERVPDSNMQGTPTYLDPNHRTIPACGRGRHPTAGRPDQPDPELTWTDPCLSSWIDVVTHSHLNRLRTDTYGNHSTLLIRILQESHRCSLVIKRRKAVYEKVFVQVSANLSR
jgi:hypothetical protein